MDRSTVCIVSESTSAVYDVPKVNWTSFVYQRQVFGSKVPKTAKKRRPTLTASQQSVTSHRRYPLREYRLSQTVMSPANLEQVFLGFSLCGNYLYSYLEVFKMGDDDENVFSMLTSERTYLFHVWRFIPGGKLRLAFRIKLFHGESFMYPLCIRVQQPLGLPGVCVVIGNLMGNDCNTLTKTLWHSVLFTPTNTTAAITGEFSFYALYALSSDLRLHDGYLVVTTCDELILLNLKKMFGNFRRSLESALSDTGDRRPSSRVLTQALGDISKVRFTGADYFPYARQTLEWCTQDAEANLRSSYVGLSDYHLYIQELSDDGCDGCIFALYDVDTNERYYYESMYTFRWDLRTNVVKRLSGDSRDVTDRSKEPGKQQKAFNELRRELFGKCVRNLAPKYELSNSSVLQGYSLQRIFDSTGCIALTL